MKLEYLISNAAYAFTFGRQLVPMDGCWLFTKRVDAMAAANECGLSVMNNGTVITAETRVSHKAA